MRIVPTFTDPFYFVKTQLDGSTYQFYFQYNHRTTLGLLTCTTITATPFAQGVKVVPNMFLLGRCHYEDNCPPGELVCCTLDPVNDSPPGLLDLDRTRHGGTVSAVLHPTAGLIALSRATGPLLLGDNG